MYSIPKKDIFAENNLNEDENLFFKVFWELLLKTNLNPYFLNLERLGNKCFNVFWGDGYYVGKIKLSPMETKSSFMQYLTDLDSPPIYVKNVTVDEYIDLLPYWISYIKNVIENKNT